MASPFGAQERFADWEPWFGQEYELSQDIPVGEQGRSMSRRHCRDQLRFISCPPRANSKFTHESGFSASYFKQKYMLEGLRTIIHIMKLQAPPYERTMFEGSRSRRTKLGFDHRFLPAVAYDQISE
jgi:hypothetical protein